MPSLRVQSASNPPFSVPPVIKQHPRFLPVGARKLLSHVKAAGNSALSGDHQPRRPIRLHNVDAVHRELIEFFMAWIFLFRAGHWSRPEPVMTKIQARG